MISTSPYIVVMSTGNFGTICQSQKFPSMKLNACTTTHAEVEGRPTGGMAKISWQRGPQLFPITDLIDSAFDPKHTLGYAISPNVLAGVSKSGEERDCIAILSINDEKPSITSSNYRWSCACMLVILGCSHKL